MQHPLVDWERLMSFDYDNKLSDPDYHGGMINISPTKESDPPNTTMEGWGNDSTEKFTKQIEGGN